MTKEETISLLQNAAWLDKSETRNKTIEALGRAVACIYEIDMIEEFVDGFASGLAKLKGFDREVGILLNVKAFVTDFKKGMFSE